MNHIALTLLILQLNKLLDSGECDSISIDEVHAHIDDGTILKFLKERGGNKIDLGSHLTNSFGDFEKFYVQHLQSLYDAYAGDERRKWGVEKKGVCLLLAWTNEILQQGTDWKPNENISIRSQTR
jgi:hypothetical protein